MRKNSQMKGENHFVYANEYGKTEIQAFNWPPGSRQSSLSLFSLFSLFHLTFNLYAPGPAISIARSDSKKGRRKKDEEAWMGC